MSHNIDIDTLKKEQDKDENLEKSFTGNPVKRVVQDLFQSEFSGQKYRKLSLEEAKRLVEQRISAVLAVHKGPYLSGGQNLLNKCKKIKNIENLLMTLNEYLFS